MALANTDFVVIEFGPLRGVNATTTYHATRNAAFTYIEARRGMFERIDICRVVTRLNVVMVPQETVEGDPL